MGGSGALSLTPGTAEEAPHGPYSCSEHLAATSFPRDQAVQFLPVRTHISHDWGHGPGTPMTSVKTVERLFPVL